MNFPRDQKNDDETAQNTQPRSQRWITVKEWIRKVFTVERLPIFISLFALAVSYRSCQNSGRSADAGKRSASAAERSAKAAQESAKTTRDMFEASQHAYVSLGKPNGILMEWKKVKAGEPAFIEMYFQNSGNTEAVEFWVNKQVTFPEVTARGRLAAPLHIRPMRPSGADIPITKTIAAKSVLSEIIKTPQLLSQKMVDAISDEHSLMSIVVDGTFEFVNIHGGYCCRNFSVFWRSDVQRFYSIPPEWNNCPTDVVSICDNGMH